MTNVDNLKFPKDFIWGVGTAAYQVEGGSTEDGRGESVWDVIRKEGNRIADESDPDLSCESYKFWRDDINLLKELGITCYRFSICWSRIFPDKSGKLNEEGLKFYKTFVEELIRNDIQPIVTLFHSDMPMYLFESGGWLSRDTIEAYLKLVDICFKTYGHLVKYWITFNEITNYGWMNVYPQKGFPNHSPTRGDRLGVEPRKMPYLAMHHMLIAHGRAYRLYEQNYKTSQNGEICLIITGRYCFRASVSDEDGQAQTRANAWKFQHILDPIYKGDYPDIMKNILGDALPSFTEEESTILKGALDIIGINYYLSTRVKNPENVELCETAEEIDGRFKYAEDLGEKISGDTWLRLHSPGLVYLLAMLKNDYDSPKILITENGCADIVGALQTIHDPHRIRYISEHILALHQAIGHGNIVDKEKECVDSNVIGYLAWSLIDNFEWTDGFSMKFGLCSVDLNSPQKTRSIKDSARFYKNFIQKQRDYYRKT